MLNPEDDFPAAHSLDCGWFAVDKNGRIAHFSTGEAGAKPVSSRFTTGESTSAEGEQLWWTHILPWIARNLDTSALPDVSPELSALFDTESNANAAAEHLGTETEALNPLFVNVPFDEGEFVTGVNELDGFVGFAPSPWAIEDEIPAEYVPIAFYNHGTWNIPGHYERIAAGHPDFQVEQMPEGLELMDTDFTEAAEIQLADFYANEDCHSWSEGDLRDGTIPPRQGFFGWLFDVLRGGS